MGFRRSRDRRQKTKATRVCWLGATHEGAIFVSGSAKGRVPKSNSSEANVPHATLILVHVNESDSIRDSINTKNPGNKKNIYLNHSASGPLLRRKAPDFDVPIVAPRHNLVITKSKARNCTPVADEGSNTVTITMIPDLL